MKILILTVITLFVFTSRGMARDAFSKSVPPVDEWNCPKTHPIKGKINPQKGTMIYHLPQGNFYAKTKPEKCFATEEHAQAEGFRKSKR